MIEPYLANAAASYHQRQAERDLRAARSTLATSGGSTRVSDLTTQVRACTSNLAGCLSPQRNCSRPTPSILLGRRQSPPIERNNTRYRNSGRSLTRMRKASRLPSAKRSFTRTRRHRKSSHRSSDKQSTTRMRCQMVRASQALACLLARRYLSTLRALLSVNPRWRRLSSCHEIGRGGQGDCTGRAVPPPGSERSAQLGGQQSRLPAGTLPAHATTHSRRGTHHLDDRHEHEHEQHGIERMMSERHLQRTVTI